MLIQFRLISVPTLLRWSPLVVLLIAAFFRFDALPDQSFWNDEGNTLAVIQRDVDGLLEAVRQDIHPPGYYLLLKGWTSLTGRNELGLRSFSGLWGLLAVAFTYGLGAKLYARAAGILAALLVALNPLAVYYSQEARMYAQLGGLSVMSLWLLLAFIQAPQRSPRRIWTAFVLAAVNALGLYTHYTYPLTMLVQGLFFVWWWLAGRDMRALGLFFAANLAALVIFAPWAPTAYDQITSWPSDDTGVALGDKIETIATYVVYGNSAADLGLVGFVMPLILFAALLLPDWYPRLPSNSWRVSLPLAWLVLIGGALLVSGAYREANLKFLIPAQMAMALILGRNAYLLWDSGSGSAAVPTEMIRRYAGAFLFLVVAWNSYGWLNELRDNPDLRRDDYRAMAARIEANADAGDAVILNAPGQIDVFSYYFNGDAAVFPLPRGLGGDDAATLEETRAVIADHQRIYVIFWGEGERDPNGVVKNTLDTEAFEVFSRWYGDVRLVEYGVLQAPPAQPDVTLNARFGEHITLEGYALDTSSPQLIGVTLFWQTDAQLDTRYKITVQIIDPDQPTQPVAQHDSEPANNRALTIDWQPGSTVIDNHGLALPTELPSGEFRLIVGMYELDAPDVRLRVNQSESLELERLSLP